MADSMGYTFAKHSGIIQVLSNGVWVDLPDPQEMEFSVYDLDSEEGAGRNQNGLMFRDRRTVKEKLSCSFPPLIGSDIHRMLSLTSAASFTARYYSPKYGAVREAVMYVGDRSSPAYWKYDAANPGMNWYQPTSMNLIEM